MTKFDQDLCEICGEPINLLEEYHDHFSDKILRPREYLEEQLNMTSDEQDVRQRFMEALFDQHFRELAEGKTTSEVIPQ